MPINLRCCVSHWSRMHSELSKNFVPLSAKSLESVFVIDSCFLMNFNEDHHFGVQFLRYYPVDQSIPVRNAY